MLLPHPPCRGMGALYKRALEASWSITDRTAPVPLVVSPAVEFPLYLEPTVTSHDVFGWCSDQWKGFATLLP